MATPEDIIEAKRIANARQMASQKTTPTVQASPLAQSLASLQASIQESKDVSKTKSIEIPTIALEQAVNTGDANAIRTAATALGQAQGLTGSELRTFSYKTTQDALKGEKPTPPPADNQFTYDYVWRQDVGGPGGKWVLVKTPIPALTTMGAGAGAGSDVGTGAGTGAGAGAGAGTGGGTGAGAGSTTKTGPTLAKDVFKQTLAMFFGQADASKPWMDELYNAVSKFYLNGADVSEALNMALLDSRNNPALKEFTDRFKGIYGLMDMKQAGKPVTIPTIAEYVSSQAKMADILTQANLAGLATTEYTGELIGKGNSVSTIADKIANVFNRIDLAPKDVKDTLSRYFPTADRLKLAGALLQGEKGVTQLADELAQYEVLAAAEAQGVGALGARAKEGGVTAERAQQYARAGGTYQSLLPKFGQVAAVTPTISKLSGISGTPDIGQVGVEKALILSGEAERAAIEKLSAQEEARFAAKAGRMEQGLASQRRANRAF